MSDTTLRTGIKTIMDTVPGAGVIHIYERLAVPDEKFIQLFLVNKKIMGWEITRVGVPRTEQQGPKFKVTHSYQIRGYYGVQDSAQSELAFSAIIDAMLIAFFKAKIAGASLHTLPSVGVIQPRMFGAVLCHYVQIDIIVPEVIDLRIEEEGDLLKIGLNYYLDPDDGVMDAQDVITLKEP